MSKHKAPSWFRNQQKAEAARKAQRENVAAASLLLQDGFREGYKKGREEAMPQAVKAVYAASVLALRHEFKWGQQRCARFIEAMDHELVESIDSDETMDKVFEELGIKINFDDPLEHVEVVK